MRQIEIRIDDKKARCAPEETILRVARRCGARIPTLCSHEALEPYGACRLCMVEVTVGGVTRLAAACTTTVREGMRVRTRTPRLRRLRQTLIGLLAARSPEAPVVRRLVRELGTTPMPAAESPDLCINCGLCVRACRDIVGAAALCFAGKGRERRATVAFYRDSRECVGCGSCVFVCPTGAAVLHDEERGGDAVRVMDTWQTRLAVRRCPDDGEPVAPERLREFAASRRPVVEGFLERCAACRKSGPATKR